MALCTPGYLRERANLHGLTAHRDALRDAADELEQLLVAVKKLDTQRDELFLENGRLANTLGAENLRLRAALKDIIAFAEIATPYSLSSSAQRRIAAARSALGDEQRTDKTEVG